MAGHSKWANIQHRKGRQDEKRGKVWTRVIREIMVAARTGGGDLGINPRVRLAVEKAKAANMPADTVKRNIDKATGNLEGVNYEEIRYEGYGIGGAAIIVDNIAGANQAHIHRAPASFFGPNVVELAAPHNPGAGNPGASTYCNNAVPATTIKDIRLNPRNFYINIHNVPYDNGALRGQLF